jgi:hypothetical protein
MHSTKRVLYLVAATFALTAMAFAQAAEFHVVQDARTKRCTVVDRKPSPSTYVTLVSSETYRTQAEAEVGILSLKICSTN